jgi:hypothetical protein
MNVNGRTEYLDIQPSNIVSTGVVSYVSGNPVIQFIIGESDRYLIGNSLRFCGQIEVFRNSAGDRPTTTDDLSISPKLGMLGIIDQIVLSSQKTKGVIEHIRHFPRWAGEYYGNIASSQEAMGHLCESSTAINNLAVQQNTVVGSTNGSVATNRKYFGNSFAVPLPTGLLNNKQPIGLSGNGWGIGGLMVEIHLSPDSNFLTTGSLTTAFYQLRNLKLVCETIVPSVDELSQLMKTKSAVLEYNAITSYYTSINSTNAIINFNLGLSKVLSVFMNFIPSEYLNNYAQDGFQCLPLINDLASRQVASIKQVVFTRGGLKLPLEYNLDTNVRDDNTLVCADPQLYRNSANAFMKFMDNKRSQLNPDTLVRKLNNATTNYEDYVLAGQFFSVGVNYDNISGEGENFQKQNFGVAMETGLTNDVPHAVFLFVRSKQTLVMNENGVQVIV